MKIPLLLNVPGQHVRTPVLVENTVPAGACAVILAKQFGYPVADKTGTAMTYRLFSADGGQALPDERSLADLQIGAGACLLLDCVESRCATLPVARPLIQSTQERPPIRSLWTRRSFLLTASVLGCSALTGLGSGWTFAIVSRTLARRGTGSPVAQAPTRNQVPITLSPALRFTGHRQKVRTAAWSPDGTLLASGGDDAQVLVWTPDGVTRAAIAHQAPVQSLAWSPESQRLITGASSQVRFLTALAGSELAVRNHAAQVTSVAWSGQGQMQAASGSADMRVIVWQTSQYQAQTVFAGHTTAIQAVSFSADGQTVASSSQGGAVRVWATANGGELHPFYLDTRLPLPSLAFAPVGATLAAGGNDGVTRLWNGLLCQATGASDQGRICVDAPQRLQLSKQPIRALAWSPDAKYLASGHEDGTLALWSLVQSRNPLLTRSVQHGTPVHAVAWSPDGKRLATAAGTTVTVWNLLT
jgi:WD40 repeat protein